MPGKECSIYEPLVGTEKNIRLLHILPGQPDSPIECRMRSILLTKDSVPSYEAVSYVWSLISGQKEIRVNGLPLVVPAAAAEVLQHLREPTAVKVVWIDSICINQTNDSERNHQVAIMGHIYQKTAKTLVWLGPADESTRSAVESLDHIYNQVLAETESCEKLRDMLYGKSQIFQYSTTGLPEKCNFEALRNLFRRPWFGRRWVVQEAALAPCGTIFCGSFSVPMRKLFRCAVWIQHKQHQLPFDLDKEEGMLNASYMSAYVDNEQGWFSARHGQRAFLADLFRYFRTFDVTNEADRVYSLLGLTRWHFQQQQYPQLVIPAYTKPVKDILRDATKAAIVESGDLWIFRFIDHLDEFHVSSDLDVGTISWVPSLFRTPDFTREPNPLRSPFKANHGLEGLLIPEHPPFNIEPDSAQPDVVTAQGVPVDEIDQISEPLGAELENSIRMAQILRRILIDRTLTTDASHSVSSEVSGYDLGLVLVGGSSFDPQPAEEGGEPRDIFRAFIEAVSANANTASVVNNRVFNRCTWAIRFACTNRRLFQTRQGHIGIGPKATRVGDMLAVLAASRMPMILRPSVNQSHAVLGPCYAHRLMQGEIGECMTEKGLMMVNFTLR